ncbi:hypothetical protein KBB49_01560 [Candidatus Saccharibacteria bacterium]|jgi:hypothetical protein|nr:hypothetical protein [Candidatus Saccharibacteria bacterium]
MDFANRGNRPVQQQQPAPQMGSEQAPAPQKAKKGIEYGKLGSVFVLIGVALLSAVLLVGLVFGGKEDKVNKESALINTDKYQAVFLNSQDGQVYFGKLGTYNSDLYVLTDIYYVRVENPIQPEGASQEAQPNISLAKLGSELHGPEDVMYIARDKVLYWENLKDDGQVVTAITKYKETGETTDTTQETDTTNQTDTTQTP